MILRHRVSSCAEFLGFKLGELGNRFPTTCDASRPVSNSLASASWEDRSQLPLISFAGSRAVAQLQVGNAAPDPGLHNLILASNPRALAVISSCGGETHPYRVGRRTPSASAGVSSSHGPFGKVCARRQPASNKRSTMKPRDVVHALEFACPPEIGTVLLREGQRYELLEVRPHVRRDGKPTWLLVWQSHCAECDRAFEVITGLKAPLGNINRRCPTHHSPGRAVSAAGAQRRNRFLRHLAARKR